MKKKNVTFWVFVSLIIAFLIFAVIFVPIKACSNKPGNSANDENEGKDPGGDVDPPHKHGPWLWSFNSVQHWQYAECHPTMTTEREAHKFADYLDPSDSKQKERCTDCSYTRLIPTSQDDMQVEFDDDGNASIGGLQDENITDLVISGTVTDSDGNEKQVDSIKEGAFKDKAGLKSVTIYDGVKEIGKDAFANCSELTSVNLPKTISYIDPEAFKNCRKLETIIIDVENPYYMGIFNCIIRVEDRCLIVGCKGSTIPTRIDSNGQFVVTSIGDGAFYGSGITEIDIPNNITSIGREAFKNSSIVTVTGLEGVTQMRESAFNDCTKLTSITLPDKITEIVDNAFDGCSSLEKVTVPAGVTIIRDYAFRGCSSLKSVTLNEGLITIAGSAFRGCSSLGSVTIPSTIKIINMGAFLDCISLTSVTIGGGVTTIGNSAFEGCKKLVEIYNLSSLDIQKGDSSYGHVAYYAKNVYTPTEGSSNLKTEDGFVFYDDGDTVYLVGYTGDGSNLILPDDFNGRNYALYQYAFYGCTSLASVTISSGVTAIGEYAFYGCTGLASVTIGNGINSIGGYAFYNCTSLADITIPYSVNSIGEYAFSGAGLTSIIIPDSITSIGSYAFYNCISLETVTISNSVMAIGECAFAKCTKLTSIVFLGTEEDWNARIKTENDWKPDGVEVTFTADGEETNETNGNDGTNG